MNTEKSFIDQIVEQIQSTVRDMENTGILDELAKTPEKAGTPQTQGTETPKNSARKHDES